MIIIQTRVVVVGGGRGSGVMPLFPDLGFSKGMLDLSTLNTFLGYRNEESRCPASKKSINLYWCGL